MTLSLAICYFGPPSQAREAIGIGETAPGKQRPVETEEGTRPQSGVTPQSLRQAGILKHLNEPVKILGNGDISTKLTVSAHRFSESAKTKIEAAGGTCILIASEEESEG